MRKLVVLFSCVILTVVLSISVHAYEGKKIVSLKQISVIFAHKLKTEDRPGLDPVEQKMMQLEAIFEPFEFELERQAIAQIQKVGEPVHIHATKYCYFLLKKRQV